MIQPINEKYLDGSGPSPSDTRQSTMENIFTAETMTAENNKAESDRRNQIQVQMEGFGNENLNQRYFEHNEGDQGRKIVNVKAGTCFKLQKMLKL